MYRKNTIGGEMFEENTIVGKIAKGEFPEETVKTKYGEFSVKFPSGEDFILIARRKAGFFGGMPIDSFDLRTINVAERDATLSTMITTYPEKFPKQWEGDGIINFPDEEVKNSIYKAFNTFYSETSDRISGRSRDKNKK